MLMGDRSKMQLNSLLTLQTPQINRREAITPYSDATKAKRTMGKATDDVSISLMNDPKTPCFSFDGSRTNTRIASTSRIKYKMLAKSETYPMMKPPVFKSEPKNDFMRAILTIFPPCRFFASQKFTSEPQIGLFNLISLPKACALRMLVPIK